MKKIEKKHILEKKTIIALAFLGIMVILAIVFALAEISISKVEPQPVSVTGNTTTEIKEAVDTNPLPFNIPFVAWIVLAFLLFRPLLKKLEGGYSYD